MTADSTWKPCCRLFRRSHNSNLVFHKQEAMLWIYSNWPGLSLSCAHSWQALWYKPFYNAVISNDLIWKSSKQITPLDFENVDAEKLMKYVSASEQMRATNFGFGLPLPEPHLAAVTPSVTAGLMALECLKLVSLGITWVQKLGLHS